MKDVRESKTCTSKYEVIEYEVIELLDLDYPSLLIILCRQTGRFMDIFPKIKSDDESD